MRLFLEKVDVSIHSLQFWTYVTDIPMFQAHMMNEVEHVASDFTIRDA